MANIKFSELASAVSLDEDDVLALSHEQGGGWTSLKTTVKDLGDKINNDITYDDLTSTDKKIVGAINEKVGWKSNGFLGAKNLNSYPYTQTTRTDRMVDWTDIGDGTIKANGTATGGSTSFNCHVRLVGTTNPLILKNGKYRITGCPSGGTDTSYRIQLYYTHDNTATLIGYEYGDGFEFTLNGDDYSDDSVQLQVQLQVIQNYTANNLVFKPMITLVEDTDSTWREYAMTNKQLTDIVNNVPDTAGTYTLQAVRNADSTITYSWV